MTIAADASTMARVRVLVSTASLGTACPQAEAAFRLRAADLVPMALGPLAGPIAGEAGDVGLAIGAFLAPGPIRPNLAAGDDDFRRASVIRYREAIAQASDLGIPAFAVSPGWALEQGLDPGGEPVGAPIGHAHAEAQLERSLDTLADVALERRIGLAILNQGPSGQSVLTAPLEIERVLGIVAAPGLGVLLDCARLEAACRPRGADPEADGTALLGLLCGVQVEGAPAAASWVRSLLASKGLSRSDLPLVLASHKEDVKALSAERARLEEGLHAPA